MRREGYAFDQCFDRCQQPSSRLVDAACLAEVKAKLLTGRLKLAFHIFHLAYIFASIDSVLFNCARSSLDILVKPGGAARWDSLFSPGGSRRCQYSGRQGDG